MQRVRDKQTILNLNWLNSKQFLFFQTLPSNPLVLAVTFPYSSSQPRNRSFGTYIEKAESGLAFAVKFDLGEVGLEDLFLVEGVDAAISVLKSHFYLLILIINF